MHMHIDPHVHCRDWREAYKSTIKDVVSLALSNGIVAVFDMPNTSPPITSKSLVKARLALARKEGVLAHYYLYIGITSEEKQITDAAKIAEHNKKVVGIKMFAGTSIGSLALPRESDQKEVYRVLAETGYEGVLAVHCEKEKYFKQEEWNPIVPATWNNARPEIAEIESVKDQIKFARKAGFSGTLHIAHVSAPESVEIIDKARRHMNITCGVTPHHLLISTKEMTAKKGLLYKVNPPIRSEKSRRALFSLLKKGKIDWIETDHAPHTLAEKLEKPYLSGIRSLELYQKLLNMLKKSGFTDSQIYKMTFSNILDRFKNKLS
ncbi:MAG: dihydroorotase [Candidatus Micrarchaeia archaeon]